MKPGIMRPRRQRNLPRYDAGKRWIVRACLQSRLVYGMDTNYSAPLSGGFFAVFRGNNEKNNREALISAKLISVALGEWR
jgi:hypothetical protein